MTVKSILIATAALLLATGAMAQSDEQAEQAASASPSVSTDAAEGEAPEEERKICRTEKATGSLTRRNRVCMTQAQWREIYDRTRKGVGEMQGSASGGNQCIIDTRGACQGPETPGMTPVPAGAMPGPF